MSEIGHNSGDSYRVTADELRQFVERIERQEDEISLAKGDLKETYAEAKGRGYDPKIVRKIVALRKRKPEAIAEEMAVLQLYGSALGMDVFS